MDPAITGLDPDLTRKRPVASLGSTEHEHDEEQEQDQEQPQEQQSDDTPSLGRRTKRKRYTAVACNECKRRKIKCNGEKPCERCSHLNVGCIYSSTCCNGFSDSVEYMRMTAQIASLQEQVNALYAAVTELRGAQSLHSVFAAPDAPTTTTTNTNTNTTSTAAATAAAAAAAAAAAVTATQALDRELSAPDEEGSIEPSQESADRVMQIADLEMPDESAGAVEVKYGRRAEVEVMAATVPG